jgi:predicted nucleic acid-binding protein
MSITLSIPPAIVQEVQYYDALVVSAAEKLGCHEIITEDLNPNQLYRGMAIVNPFAED